MNKETPMASKKYRLQNMPGHFYTGHLKDGTQVFMSVDYPNLIAALFDREGTYLKSLTRELSQTKMFDFKKSWEDLNHWAEELGLVKGVISVKKFSFPADAFGIQDLPAIYQEFLDSGKDIPEDIQEYIKRWKEDNDFVLLWGQEYDIDRKGKVMST